MPLIDDRQLMSAQDHPDQVPRPVVTFGVALVSSSLEMDFHRHRKAQLLISLRGVLTCEVASGLWIVPPQCAMWVPGGALHAIKAAGPLEGYNVFVEPSAATKLPKNCCTVSVTPLLRELVVRSASFPVRYPKGGTESRLVRLLLDELAGASIGNLHVPMPADARLRKIVERMMARPADRGTMESWAKRAGLSERTLTRLISRETGMSFGRWRQQIHIMLALQWLAEGASIQRVSAKLGYESAGSFITMFRKVLGASPGRYMAERESQK